MKNGDVSIVIPMYNAACYIEETLASVLAQAYKNWELIVVDDGSTDASAAKVQEFISHHPCEARLLCHPHQANRGTSASRNLGMRHAGGEFLCFLDADDVWHPDFLEHFANILDENPEVSMTYGPALLWHTDQNGFTDREQDLGIQLNRKVDPYYLFKKFLDGEADTPSPSGVMMRRSTLAAVGGWEDAFSGMYDDQVVYSKLLLSGGGAYVTSRCLYRYRQHADSVCKTAARERKNAESREKYLEWLGQYLVRSGKWSEDAEILVAEQMWNVQRLKDIESSPQAGWWVRKLDGLGSLANLLGNQRNFVLAIKLFRRILGQQITGLARALRSGNR